MVASQLCLHRGARLVDYDELASHKAPPPQGRWYPLSHSHVLNTVKSTLAEAGYEVRSQKLALSKNNHQFFGTLDLGTALTPGVSLAVGVRSSTDQSIVLGFIGGSHVFCCDNMAFRSDLMVKRKHTINGERNFVAAIVSSIASLTEFKEVEAARIDAMMRHELRPEVADSLILRAFERGIVSAPQLPQVIREWREPRFDEFRPRTVWSLFNAFTTVLGPRATSQPQKFAVQTMRLNALVEVSNGSGANDPGSFVPDRGL